jgi:hypothetical protein
LATDTGVDQVDPLLAVVVVPAPLFPSCPTATQSEVDEHETPLSAVVPVTATGVPHDDPPLVEPATVP